MQWSPNLCRICGDLKVCQTISAGLKDKIKRYLNIQIETGDEYKPHHVCCKCISKLNKFGNFIDLSHKNDTKFDSLYKSCIEVSNKDKNEKIQNFCLKPFKSSNELERHKGDTKLFTSKSQHEYQRRRSSKSTSRKHNRYKRRFSSLKRKKNSHNRFQGASKKYLGKTALKSKSPLRLYKDKRVKPKSSYTRYLDICRKYLKVKLPCSKNGNKSTKK